MQRMVRRTLCAALAVMLIASLLIPALTPEVSALSYSGSSSYQAGRYYRNLIQVQLTGDHRTDIVNIAKSQVGYQEGSSAAQLSGEVYGGGNCTEYGSWYGFQDMWCAMFVSWCANLAGISQSVIPTHAFTPDGLRWFRNRDLAYSRAAVEAGEYTPRAGDLIYFKSSRNENTTNHVGIVIGYADGVVYTVEGNTGAEGISTNGGTVAQKSYPISNTYIVYICSPDYQVGSTSTGPAIRPSEKDGAALTQDGVLTSRGNPGVNAGLYPQAEQERENSVYTPDIPSGYANAAHPGQLSGRVRFGSTFGGLWSVDPGSFDTLCRSNRPDETEQTCWYADRTDSSDAWTWYQTAASGRNSIFDF